VIGDGKAPTPAIPKQSGNWLAKYAGDSGRVESADESMLDDVRGLVRDLADMARAIESAGSHGIGSGSVVDVEGTDVK
jgi:hypothetical protein